MRRVARLLDAAQDFVTSEFSISDFFAGRCSTDVGTRGAELLVGEVSLIKTAEA